MKPVMKPVMMRKLVAELLGTATLVFVAVGAATLAFGFALHGGSIAAGVVMTALAFGLVLAGLAYAIGAVSGCHVNPAVTLGFVVAKRLELRDAAGYWAAQVAGGLLGALLLWAVLSGPDLYSRAAVGPGANGYGIHSMLGVGVLGAIAIEIVLTFVFVLVVLATTAQPSAVPFAGLAIGAALTVVHLIGIPLTGTSVNPARSLGPALVTGGTAFRQLWLFLLAPLAGGALAAMCWRYLLAGRGKHADTTPETRAV